MSIDLVSKQTVTIEASKFETCGFRSGGKVEQLIKRCSCQGGNYTVKGYFCEKRQIFDVKNGICESCTEYRHK
jgi:hypothetical protein